MIENDIILNIIILCQIILGLFFILLDVNIFGKKRKLLYI